MFDDTTAQLEAEETTRNHPRSILIIDDDPGQVDVLSHRLARQGYRMHLAETGSYGLDVARQQRPHLILLDVRLPDRDGFSICEELCDDAATCSIPVIILSGMERPDIIRRARAAGCQYYVRKPYDPNALLILVEQAINESEGW